MTLEHSTYCICNGNWGICCDNPANYPVHLGGDMILWDECCCGCKGDWSVCDNNRENYTRDYNYSLSPSPYRHDDDWFTQDINPVMEEKMCDIPIRSPNLPQIRTLRIKESFLQRCVERYYDLN